MALIKLVRKTFTVHQKSVKTAKVFFCVGFVVYGIINKFYSCYMAAIVGIISSK